MSTANEVFHEFIDQVHEGMPDDVHDTRFYFTDEIEDFLKYLEERVAPRTFCDGPHVVKLFAFNDGSVIRFADVEQLDGPCQVDVLDATMGNEELRTFAGVLVRMSLQLMTLVSEKPADLDKIEAACVDAEEAIGNIRSHFGLWRDE